MTRIPAFLSHHRPQRQELKTDWAILKRVEKQTSHRHKSFVTSTSPCPIALRTKTERRGDTVRPEGLMAGQKSWPHAANDQLHSVSL